MRGQECLLIRAAINHLAEGTVLRKPSFQGSWRRHLQATRKFTRQDTPTENIITQTARGKSLLAHKKERERMRENERERERERMRERE